MSDTNKVKTTIWEEAPGVKSFTRVFSGILIMAGIVIGFVGFFINKDALTLASLFIGFGVGQKVGSKFAEPKETSPVVQVGFPSGVTPKDGK